MATTQRPGRRQPSKPEGELSRMALPDDGLSLSTSSLWQTSLCLRNRSPTGPEWGYPGVWTGPACPRSLRARKFCAT